MFLAKLMEILQMKPSGINEGMYAKKLEASLQNLVIMLLKWKVKHKLEASQEMFVYHSVDLVKDYLQNAREL